MKRRVLGLVAWLIYLGALMYVTVSPENRGRVMALSLPVAAVAYLVGEWIRRRRRHSAGREKAG